MTSYLPFHKKPFLILSVAQINHLATWTATSRSKGMAVRTNHTRIARPAMDRNEIFHSILATCLLPSHKMKQVNPRFLPHTGQKKCSIIIRLCHYKIPYTLYFANRIKRAVVHSLSYSLTLGTFCISYLLSESSIPLFEKQTFSTTGRYWVFTRMIYLPMAYLFGKKFVGPITSTILALRDELYSVPYNEIDWNKARDTCAKVRFYYFCIQF